MLDFIIKTETLTVEQIIKIMELYDKDAKVMIQRTGESRKAIEVLQSKKTACMVYPRGIFITGKYYYSDDFANLLGKNVLVTDPVDGSVEVFSIEGKHLTTAFVKDSDKMINSVNLEVKLSTLEDAERLRKLCDELQQSLNSKEEEEAVLEIDNGCSPVGTLDKEIKMLMTALQEKSSDEQSLMIHVIQSMRFLNNALKNNTNKMLSVLLALDESAEIHWSKDGSIIHASFYHLISRQKLIELDLKVMSDNSACIMKTKFL